MHHNGQMRKNGHFFKMVNNDVFASFYKYQSPKQYINLYRAQLYHFQYAIYNQNFPFPSSSRQMLPQPLMIAPQGWKTNWNKHSIPLNELLVVKKRDDIPSIDEPSFETINSAKSWLGEKEPVIVIKNNNNARAYPLQIMMWHEIVNDVVEGVPLAITYCPLCNSAFVFNRTLNGQTFEFGTTGLLRFSNLVMYDRATESLWQQFTGEAIVGELTVNNLSFLPCNVASFEDFSLSYPDGLVLSRNTGYIRNYGQNPYVNYDEIGNQPFLFKGSLDTRLPAMERVVGVWTEGRPMAYPFSTLKNRKVIQEQNYVIFHESGMNSAVGDATIAQGKDVGATGVFSRILNGEKLSFFLKENQFHDNETCSRWSILGKAMEGQLAGQNLNWINHGDPFWFAWAAFCSQTGISK